MSTSVWGIEIYYNGQKSVVDNYELSITDNGQKIILNGIVGGQIQVPTPPPATGPVSGACPAAHPRTKIYDYNSFFGIKWPLDVSEKHGFRFPKNEVSVFKLNSGNYKKYASSFTSIEDTMTVGVRYGTVSKCPGVKNRNFKEGACTHAWGIGGGLQMYTQGANLTQSQKSRGCFLEPNTDYYITFWFSDNTRCWNNDQTCTTTISLATRKKE